ncbi:MAG: replication-associated recombination protein A [Bdellovibrio sp. CG10_big_fil_rev_8_21_14_0_10_47_8]|nr:MAG: replication-associated recombination protein A [Bdellovibrio sp. CG10_big_fil_rev_8_21_14_0_10_47_8]
MDLFSAQTPRDLPGTPLAERLRPLRRQELIGQERVLKQMERYVQSGFLPSLIFWGPPGTGKTTLAQALAHEFEAEFISVNAVETGAKALKEIGEAARLRRQQYQRKTILFVDEIHRLNKAQQDVLLPFVETGHLVLIGATTENPSYEINRALLSRCRLVVFERHDASSLKKIFERAQTEGLVPEHEKLQPELQEHLFSWADGDARRLLVGIEEISSHFKQSKEALTLESLQFLLGGTVLGYDRQSEQHYDVISAFIKSVRGSDADAALYYLARMLKGGEDPVFISRRLVILASEDVGNADPRALQVAVAGAQAVELIGLPEGAINLAQVVTYLASAPKSNRSYLALKKAQQFVDSTGTQPVPLSLRSSKTPEMKALGYGKDYLYPHDHPRHWVAQNYWPKDLKAESFYQPSQQGFEKQIIEYKNWLKGHSSDT